MSSFLMEFFVFSRAHFLWVVFISVFGTVVLFRCFFLFMLYSFFKRVYFFFRLIIFLLSLSINYCRCHLVSYFYNDSKYLFYFAFRLFILCRMPYTVYLDRTLDMVDEAKVNVIDKRLSAMVKSMDDRFSTMVGQGGSCLQLMRNAEMNTSKAYAR